MWLLNGQILIGGAGCGKTSFCILMKKLISLNKESPVLINLDPGGISSVIKFDINIQEIIHSEEILSELNIGPNSSLLYSIEYFEKNIDWFENKFTTITCFFFRCSCLFDFPGQMELFTYHLIFKKLVKKLSLKIKKLVVIIFSDSFFFKDKSSNGFCLLNCMIVVLNMTLPCFHLISKEDLFKKKTTTIDLQNYYSYRHSFMCYHAFCFFWSKKLPYDIVHLITGFSWIKLVPFVVYCLDKLKLIYKKIKNITAIVT